MILAGCGGNPVTQSTLIEDADRYTYDGVNAFADADWTRAKFLFTRALSLYQGIDDQKGALNSHLNLAEVALSTRNYHTVRNHLHRADTIAKTVSLQHYQARIALLSAQSALQQKQYARAEKVLQSLLPEFDEVTPENISGNIQIAAIANRTLIAFAQKRNESLWTQRYGNALKSSSIKTPDLEARLLRFKARLLENQGNFEQAESLLLPALSEYKTHLSRPGIAATLVELGQLSMKQGRWRQAQDYLNRAILVLRYIGDLDRVIHVTENLIKVETELGNSDRSDRLKKWLIEIKDEKLDPDSKNQNVQPTTGVAIDSTIQ